MVIGIVGNIIVLIVFYLGRAYRRNVYRVFVINFALVDLFACAILFPADIIKNQSDFNFHNAFLCQLKTYITNFGAMASALSLLVISVDRFRKVVFPLKTQMSQPLAIKLCIGIPFVFSIIANIPLIVVTNIQETLKINIYGTNTTVFICGFDQAYKGHPLVHITLGLSAIVLIGVSVSTIVMYICIGVQIKKHSGAMPVSMISGSHNQNSFTSESSHTSPIVTKSTTATDDTHPSSSRHSSKSKSELAVQFQNSVPPSVAVQDKTADNIETDNGIRTEQADTSDEAVSSADKTSLDTDLSQLERKKMITHQNSNQSTSSAGVRPKLDTNLSLVDRKKMLIKQNSQHSTSSLWSTLSGGKRRNTLRRQQSGFGMRRFPYKTLIWFILTLVFILTNLLSLFLGVAWENADRDPADNALYMSLHKLYYINNIINPIVYFSLDKHFRSVCRNIIPRLKSRFADCCK